jgi:uncharacterized protein (TIGR02246 family)
MHTLIIENLYEDMIECWNRKDAVGMTSYFTRDACIVGFDGGCYAGKADFEKELEITFADQDVATYVGVIRDVRLLSPDICLLQAAAGMVPPGQRDIDPSKNAIHTLLFQYAAEWKIALFQNTPARFPRTPKAAKMAAWELRRLIPVAG